MLRNALRLLVLSLLVTLPFLAACGADPAPTPRPVAEPAVSKFYSPPPATTPARAQVTQGQELPRLGTAGRMLVRRGELSIEVEDFDAAREAVLAIAGSNGAYVENADASRADEGPQSGHVVLRVPVGAFDRTYDALSAVGEVRRGSAVAEDVTAEYADLGIRIDSKRKTLARLQAILQDRTAELEDILAVEKEIGRLILTIDQLEGRSRGLSREAALATIRVEMYEPTAEVAVASVYRQAFESGVETLKLTLTAAIYIGTAFGPWMVAAAIAFTWLGRRRRRAGAAT